MKQLEIDETETQLVIKVVGSSVAHVAMKDNAENIRETLLAVLAEAPVVADEPEPAASASVLGQAAEALDGDEMGAVEAVRTVMGVASELLNSPEAKQLKGLFEKLPKTKAQRNAKKSG